MTGPSGKGLSIYLPLEIQDCLPKSLSEEIDLPITLETSHYLLYYSYLFGPIGEYQHVLTCVHLECFMHFFNFMFSEVLVSVSSRLLMWFQA